MVVVVIVIVMVMMMGCGAVGLVVIGEPKGLTLHWTRPLTCTLNLKSL